MCPCPSNATELIRAKERSHKRPPPSRMSVVELSLHPDHGSTRPSVSRDGSHQQRGNTRGWNPLATRHAAAASTSRPQPDLRLELTRDDEPDRVLRRALGASGSSSMANRAASDVVRSAGLASNAGLRD